MGKFIFNETERTIAVRYIKSRRVEGFISVSAWFSLIGIILGVATLIVVMSVMNGFRTELVDRILGINGHLIVYKKNGLSIENYNKIVNHMTTTLFLYLGIKQKNFFQQKKLLMELKFFYKIQKQVIKFILI